MNSTTKGPNYKHGLINIPEYRVWIELRRRCRDSRRSNYKDYGGRGITVCERWSNFKNFYEDMGVRPSKTHQIDRIDNDGNYEPRNCRWSTVKEQSQNRRSNHLIKYKGQILTIQQWCDKLNMPDTTFHNRLRRGWSINKIINSKWL